MDIERAKELLPIIQAFAEGKKVEFALFDDDGAISEWSDVHFHKWVDNHIYRIKPEPKYRPFKYADECWQEMQKHQPFGWVKLKDTESGYYMLKGIESQVVIGFNETPFSYKRVFEYYTFADGTPFGIKVEDKEE